MKSDEENRAIKNLQRDQQVLRKTYDKLLSTRAESMLAAPPPSLGEAESIVGSGGLGRTPAQLDIPSTLTQGLSALNPTPQEIATLTSRNADFAPLNPMASIANPNAPLTPLQSVAFPTVVKEQAQAAYAPAGLELKNVNGKWMVFNKGTAVATPVQGAPEGGTENPESPIGKLLADRNKYKPDSAEYKALDMAVKIAANPPDQLVTLDANGKPTVNQSLLEAKKGIAEAGAQKNITNIQNFTPASEEAQKDFIKSARTTFDQLKTVPSQLDNLEKAKKLIAGAKGFMGTGGETLLTAAKFLNNRLGLAIDTEGVKSAEELRSRIFFNIMENLKKVDAQPSQMQQLIMQESLGQLGTDPNAMPHILDAYAGVLRNRVKLYNEEVGSAEVRGVKFPYDPKIKLPQTDEEIAAELMQLRGKKRGR